jgi:hypothetical protein
MNDYIDDIVCELLDNEHVADPTQAIENLASLHDVFEKYGEQPELVKLTGLTNDAVAEYLDKADASLEGFFTKIKDTISKKIENAKKFLYSKKIESLKSKLKPGVTYKAVRIGKTWDGYINAITTPNPYNDISFEEYKRQVEEHKEKYKLEEFSFSAYDFDRLISAVKKCESCWLDLIKSGKDDLDRDKQWQKNHEKLKRPDAEFKEMIQKVKLQISLESTSGKNASNHSTVSVQPYPKAAKQNTQNHQCLKILVMILTFKTRRS